MKKDYSLQNVIQTIENYIDEVSNSDIEVDIVKTLNYVEILSELLKYEEDNIDFVDENQIVMNIDENNNVSF